MKTALQLEDGALIRQSMGVLQYLEERYAHIEPNMSGSTIVERARIRDICGLVDEAATHHFAYMLHASTLFTGLNPVQTKVEAERNKALRDKVLKTLAEWTASTTGFLLGGEHPTIADIALFSLIQSGRMLYGDSIAEDVPRLEEAYQTMSRIKGTEAPAYPADLAAQAKGRIKY